MRRPAVVLPAAFALGIVLEFYFNMGLWLWIAIVMVCVFLTGFFAVKKTGDMMFYCMLILCFAAAGGCAIAADNLYCEKKILPGGSMAYVEGIVLDVEQKDSYCGIVVKEGCKKVLVQFYGKTDGLGVFAGSTLKACGEVKEPAAQRNPGCFDYGLYLRSCGIMQVIGTENVEIDREKCVPALRMSAEIKEKFQGRLKDSVEAETAGFIMGILFGEKDGLAEDIYEEFQGNGTAHILAVSGLHVGILYGFFVFLWRWKKGTAFYLITMLTLLFYVALADFSPSVVRAAAMIVLHATSGIMNRRYDLMSAGGTVFFAMLLNEPYSLFNTGFQMSFLAVLTIGIVIPYMKNFYNGVFLTSAAIQMGLVPYTAFTFNYFSAGAVFINVPVIFAGGILLPAGLILLILTAVPGDLFEITAGVVASGCNLLISMNRLFYSGGRFSWDVPGPPVFCLIMYYGLLVLWTSEAGQLLRMRQKKKMIYRILIMMTITAICASMVMPDGFKSAEVVFVDVGQGSCIHIRTGDGKNYLVDGGGSEQYDVGANVLKPYLLKNGVRKIDLAVVTHLHEDHFGGIRSLNKDGMIEKIGVYDGNRTIGTELTGSNAEVIYLYSGMKIRLSDDVFLEVIAPEKLHDSQYEEIMGKSDEENKNSLILKLNYRGCSILFTGDIDTEGEAGLLEAAGDRLDCDVITVPHHGSIFSSSETFVSAVSPDVAVFQVGRNNYGHPAGEIIKRYRQYGSSIFRNDTDGAVGLDIKKDGSIKVVKMID